ncbi:hypothetical protein BY996DRAFT_6898668 [Phakopsora pachyrhizi]|nr:hypothetical protein BY996DRAFT_6898668 [Phakopsora pachyrhizi]
MFVHIYVYVSLITFHFIVRLFLLSHFESNFIILLQYIEAIPSLTTSAFMRLKMRELLLLKFPKKIEQKSLLNM